jgi:hypothetical protein
MTVSVYVGDVTENLANVAAHADPAALLITSANYECLKPGTYYTSIGDLDKLSHFANILQQADTIVYIPSDHWSDERKSVSLMKYWTEKYLSIMCCDSTKTVVGFDVCTANKTKMLELADTRKSDKHQIWVAGCSISHGVGVEDHERYGALIAAELNQPVSFLTKPGSSIKWAADQIIRSDIRPNDTIFWGITSIARFTYWNEQEEKIKYAVLQSLKDYDHTFLKLLVNEKYFASDHIIYESLTSIHSVINFCKINNVTLIFATVLEGMEIYFQNFTNFTPLGGILVIKRDERYLDLGTDNQHPGPKTHDFYKNKMLKLYYQHKWSKSE